MKKRCVLMVLDGKFPGDIRVEKEALVIGRNHKVVVLSSKDRKGSSTSSSYTLDQSGPSLNKYLLSVRQIFLGILFIDPWVFFSVKKAIKIHNPDFIHVHDLPQFNSVYKAANGIPVVLDLHENYPEASLVWFAWRQSALLKLKHSIANNYSRWKRFEKWSCLRAHLIIAVVDEMKSKLIKDFGIEPEKIRVISNTESASFLDSIENTKSTIFDSSKKNILYIGGIGPHRGLDDAIIGMGKIRKDLSDSLVLNIIGGGHSDNINYLKNIVKKEGLESRVKFFSSVPSYMVSRLMKDADINLIPHKSNGHCDNTIPHKLFQSILVGKPLVVSSSSPLKRIASSVGLNSVFDADNPTSFAKTIEEVLDNYDELLLKASKASLLIREGENSWKRTEEKLESLYI